jgi:hypothetical protein
MSKPTIFISPELVGSYRQQIAQEGSSATAKRKMSSLSRFFDWAEGAGHIDQNPLAEAPTTSYQAPQAKLPIKNIFRFGILGALVILIFLFISFRLKIKIPFLPAPAQETTETVVVATPTPQPQEQISQTDTNTIIASLREEITKLVAAGVEWASLVDGNLLIGEDSVEQITIATADTTDGDINLNPDGSGNLNLIFEGIGGNQINAQSANLINGSLYYGYISNNSNNPYLIKLDSGSTPDTKFSVRADGYTQIDGSLNLAGDLQFNGLTRLSQSGKLDFVTGYFQSGGNFEIDQNASDFVGITKDLDGATTATANSVILNFQEVNPTNYDTLVLKRTGGTNDAFALLVDEGNARFDGQLQLGRFATNPTAVGTGSLIYNTTDLTTYVWNGSSWTTFGGASGTGTNGQVTFWTGTSSISGDNSFFWDNSNKRLGIGTIAPDSKLHLVGGDTYIAPDTGYAFDNPSVNEDLYVFGNLEADGNVYLGASTANSLTVNGYVTSDLIPDPGSSRSLGNSARRWLNIYGDTANFSNLFAASVDIAGTIAADFLINSDNATADTENSTLTFERGSPATNAQFKWVATGTPSKLVSVNAPFWINPDPGITFSGTAALIIDQIQNQDIFTASASGTPRLALTNTGNLQFKQASTIDTSAGDLTLGAAGNLIFNSTGNTIDINDSIIDLATQAVTIALNNAVDALNFDINTLSLDALNNRVGIGTASPDQKLDILDATNPQLRLTYTDATAYTDFQTNASGDLNITAAGADISMGSATAEHNLSLYGDLTQPGNSDLTAVSSIVDTYVYDTTKDPDGGTWTNNATAQQLSWYTEAKDDGLGDVCNIATDDRCGKSAFPKKAIIVSTSENVYIFDAQDNSLWMRFETNANDALGGTSVPHGIFALNGTLYVTMRGSSGQAFAAIDFRQDKMYMYTVSGRYDSGTGRIGDRNGTITFANLVNDYSVYDSGYDVHAVIINGRTFIAVATSGAVNIVRPDEGKAYQYSDTDGDDYYSVWLTQGGDLYAANGTVDQLERWDKVQFDNANEITGTPDAIWDENSEPALTTVTPVINTYPSALFVNESENKIYMGTDQGLSVIGGGSIKRYTTTYITETIPRNDLAMWPFLESSGTLVDVADVNRQYLEDEGPPTYSVNGVRGYSLTFNGTDDFLCSDANNDGTCDSDTDFSFTTGPFYISLWFKTTTDPGVGTYDAIVDRHHLATTGAASDGFIISLQPGGLIQFGVDDDATFGPEDNVTSTAAYNDGQWHHLVATARTDVITAATTVTGALSLFIDGEEAGTADESFTITGSISDGVTVMTVGAECSVIANCTTGQNHFGGSIDELTIGDKAINTDDIRRMHLSGKQALQHRTIAVTDATDFSSTTIGDSAETWTPNEFVGSFVEITGNTGISQTRRIIQNTATVLTVSPSWTTTPDATSDFQINPNELYGGTNIVTSVGVSDGGPSAARTLYVGTSDGLDNGGVTALRQDGDYTTDLYHGHAGRTDDSGAAWNTTTDYDDIQTLSAHSDVLSIGSSGLYWQEYGTRSLTEKVDSLTNTANTLQAAISGALSDTHRQDDTTNSSVGYQVIRKGWGWMLGDGVNSAETETVTYGITYDEPPITFGDMVGSAGTVANPFRLDSCTTNNPGISGSAQTPTKTTVDVSIVQTAGTALGSTTRYCYTWLAIGTYTPGAVTSPFAGVAPWANGADLAEWYATNDTSLAAGEVVSIDKSGEIKVARSQSAFDPTAIGIIATQPALTIGPESGLTPGYKNDTQSPSGKSVAVALAGRVPVKVSLEGGPIKAGDALTSASTPGYAMKATKAGPTIGKALEDFDGSSTIVTLAEEGAQVTENPTLTEGTGPEVIAQDPALAELNAGRGVIMTFVNTSWYDPDAQLSDLSAFQLRLNEIKRWILENSEQVVERVGAYGEFIAANIKSGMVETTELLADTIRVNTKITSPIVETNVLSPVPETDLAVELAGKSRFVIQDADKKEVAAIDNQGNATFSGVVKADKIAAQEATIAGTLYADQIQATNLAQIEATLHQAEEEIRLLSESKDWQINTASESGVLNNNQLAVISSLSVADSFTLGTDLFMQSVSANDQLASTTIDTLKGPLKLQSLALAPIELMAGKIRIDTNGNVTIAGNLEVAGKIKSQELATEKLVIAGSVATPSASLIDGLVIETNATAGKSTIPEQTSEITIKNKDISDTTLVYITPTSPTLNNVLYVKAKSAGFFKVGFDEPLPIAVDFNWWVIDNR